MQLTQSQCKARQKDATLQFVVRPTAFGEGDTLSGRKISLSQHDGTSPNFISWQQYVSVYESLFKKSAL